MNYACLYNLKEKMFFININTHGKNDLKLNIN